MTIDYRVDKNLVLSLQEQFISSGGISSSRCFVRVPGTVQAIQLCLWWYIENITASPEQETVENVRKTSRVNYSIETSDGEGIAPFFEKVKALHPFDEKKTDAPSASCRFGHLQTLSTRSLGSAMSCCVSSPQCR